MYKIPTICGKEVLVDKDIYEKYRKHNWRVNSRGDVVTAKLNGKREVSLKRLVVKGEDLKADGRRIYIINGDNLNLKRSNLKTTNVDISERDGTLFCTHPNGKTFKVDARFREFIERYSWSISPINYVSFVKSKGNRVYLHREITGVSVDLFIDHINGDTLDNRLENLRVCTHRENMFNRVADSGDKVTSKYKGVSKNPSGTFTVRIRNERLGTYANEEVAANVYNHHAKKKFGDFAYLNDVKHIPIEICEKSRL